MAAQAVATIGALEPLEGWIAEELARGDSHLDGFTWRTDPPTDEGFTIPHSGDAELG